MLVAAAAGAWGVFAAIHYHRLGLTLAHYDARAHLVVARRIFDSLMPGWQQVGAVWLPLPHLLNALPVQIDWLYRTGFSAIAISIASCNVSNVCQDATQRLGTTLYKGGFNPQFTSSQSGPPQESFNVTVPSTLPTGAQAVLSVSHFSLVGVSEIYW